MPLLPQLLLRSPLPQRHQGRALVLPLLAVGEGVLLLPPVELQAPAAQQEPPAPEQPVPEGLLLLVPRPEAVLALAASGRHADQLRDGRATAESSSVWVGAQPG